MVFIAALYALVGVAFALPASRVRARRLAAWAVSAVVYAVHLVFERFHRRNSSLLTALHVASAAALGAFGLAVGAIVHSFSVSSTSQHRRLLLVALVAWPLITGVPAFLVGLGVSGLPAKWSRRARAG